MALTIFSSYNDIDSIKRFLTEKGFEIKGNEVRWDAICTSTSGFLFMKKIRSIKFSYDGDWCSPPNWPTQIKGMQNYMARFPMGPTLRSRIHDLIGSFNLALGIETVPDMESPNDVRVDIAGEICRLVDGVFFTPVSLLDGRFKTIIDLEGVTDPTAKFPSLPSTIRKQASVAVPAGEASVEYASTASFVLPLLDDRVEFASAANEKHAFEAFESEGDGPESISNIVAFDDGSESESESDIHPPIAERVAKRMYCLAAVAGRGLIEMNYSGGKPVDYTHQDLISWISHLDIVDEFEPDELELLRTPSASLPEEWIINAVWRLEGVAVLAWALGLMPLPAYDDLVDSDQLFATLNFMGEPDNINHLIKNASLLSPNSMKIYNDQVFAFHWRMVDFQMRPQAIDFRTMERECWFGPLNLAWARFSENDLDLRGRAISEAPPQLVSSIQSIASERHIASNWLMGQDPVYSAIDAST